jgi:Arc/MetJ-type ribon-helix-helix transcriptional regulator
MVFLVKAYFTIIYALSNSDPSLWMRSPHLLCYHKLYVIVLPWCYHGITMTTINVKITNRMDSRINAYLKANPYYMNKSEMVRDAIRHLIEEDSRLSAETLKVIEKGRTQVERGKGKTLDEVEQ